MNNVDSIIIHLDSRFKTTFIENDANGYPLTTNYTYTLVEGLPIPDNKICEVSLYTATIPYSFYNIRPGVNDTFTVRAYIFAQSHVDETFTIPPGNYSANGLRSIFTTLQKAGQTPQIADMDFAITYKRETMAFNFEMDKEITHLTGVSVTFDNCAAMYGLRHNAHEYAFTTVGTNHSLLSEICVDISDSIHGLYIRQNLATKSTLDNEAGTFSNILTRIPINTNPGGIIFSSPANSTHRAITDLHAIQTIGVKLTDDNNRSIDLNGLHWQMSLLITLIDRPIVTPQLTKFTRRLNEIQFANHQQLLTQGNRPIIKRRKTKKKTKTKKKKKIK